MKSIINSFFKKNQDPLGRVILKEFDKLELSEEIIKVSDNRIKEDTKFVRMNQREMEPFMEPFPATLMRDPSLERNIIRKKQIKRNKQVKIRNERKQDLIELFVDEINLNKKLIKRHKKKIKKSKKKIKKSKKKIKGRNQIVPT